MMPEQVTCHACGKPVDDIEDYRRRACVCPSDGRGFSAWKCPIHGIVTVDIKGRWESMGEGYGGQIIYDPD
jgi:hypothetical protein